MLQAPLVQSMSISISPAKIWSSFPSAPGIIENVFEIPSWESLKGSFATDASDATAPNIDHTKTQVTGAELLNGNYANVKLYAIWAPLIINGSGDLYSY